MTLRGAARVVGYNVLIFFVVANVLYWSIPTIGAISQWAKPADLIGISYQSFIGWRLHEFKSPNFNVEGPYSQRRTVNDGARGDKKVYFFGGSTMWGYGVPDQMTIPSYFAQLTGLSSENFAQPAYTAHQSLVWLLQILQDGHRPDAVVFYDGANEIRAKCPRQHNAYSHMREHEFDTVIFNVRPESYSHHFRAVNRLVERVQQQTLRALGGNPWDCDANHDKAEAVAENLVRDWQYAKKLVEGFNIKFFGILQPVAYQGRADLAGVKLEPFLDREYEAVYSRVRRKIADDPDLYDLTSAVDGGQRVYFDFNHINADGNRLVAGKIAELFSRGTFSPRADLGTLQ